MTNWLRQAVVGLSLLLLVLGIYLLRLNRIAGQMVDDAWYILLARSLAEGHGYRMISSAVEPILPLYPPGWPAVLSVVFHVSPGFPDNVLLLKTVSIAAMIGVGFLTFVYLRTHRQIPGPIAGTSAVGTAIVPAFVFLATSTLMSECVFTVAQLAAVVLAHRAVESARDRRGILLVMTAAAVAVAVLVRSAAAGLFVAIVLWLIKEGLWKHAVLFVAAVLVCLSPWLIYARANAPTTQQRLEHGGAVVYSYGEQFWMRWAGGPAAGRVTASDIPARVATNLTDVFARGMGGVFVPAFLRGAHESGEEVAGLGPGSMGDATVMMAISIIASVVLIAGYIATARHGITLAELLVPISIAIILVWPFWSFRFVLPLTPFLFLYLINGLQLLTRSVRTVRLTLLCIVGFYVYDHAGYILFARIHDVEKGIEWIDRAKEVDATLEWVATHLPDDGKVATTNSALLYLRTGRKSLAYDNPTLQLHAWRARGFRYLISLYPMALPPEALGKSTVLYHSPARLWVIEL